MALAGHRISQVAEGSIAEAMGLAAGDLLLSVNDCEIEDIFDYQYQVENEHIEVLIQKSDEDEAWLLEIDKDEDEDLGLSFEEGLMDRYRSCCNHCIFCFIDQMPPGMRETLYFKDDDARLSFLQGNYVTLTNMTQHEIERIIRYRMSPINLSIHTTNPALRQKMLRNQRAGDIFDMVKQLADAGITLNAQIVLCKGINDGAELVRTMNDLKAYLPSLSSVSVVPVGLTKYREKLHPLETFDSADAREVLRVIEAFQAECLAEHGTRLVHASDEWYLLAGKALPKAEEYEGYPQLENGVGMLRLLSEEFTEALDEREGDEKIRRLSVATGALASGFLKQLFDQARIKYPGLQINTQTIRNDFFGPLITVSGLLVGADLISQCKGMDLGETLLIPANMLRYGEDVFLDDVTIGEAEQAIGVPIRVVDPSGEALLSALLGENGGTNIRRQQYEQSDRSDRR